MSHAETQRGRDGGKTKMKKLLIMICAAVASMAVADECAQFERRISIADFRDRMAGAWIGQSVGVSYGWPTEFKFCGELIPPEKMPPKWTPKTINETFTQDDLYVEMTFLDTLDRRGIDVSSRLAGIDFANSTYRLWCANMKGRNNLRHGIAPPWSGHPAFHQHPYDLDYQIESDFSGIISPGCPNRAVALGNTFGAIMNFGDGLYAGQFIGAMYSEAYFLADRLAIVDAALRYIPSESRYAEMVRDVKDWYLANPSDWEATWKRVVDKYYFVNPTNLFGRTTKAELDVRVNGAFVVLGLLYGDGDIEKTLWITTRCGCDSDCNPSSACGVLFASMGLKSVPDEYKSGLSQTNKWENTDYTYTKLLEVTERVARANIIVAGGRIEKDESGNEWVVVPVQKPCPNTYECVSRKTKQPPYDVRYTDVEMAQILYEPAAAGKPSKRRAGK